MLSYSLLVAALAVSLSAAQDILDDLSFGHKKGGISTDGIGIAGWSILGQGHLPQLMSDKIMLTPPYGGGKRGALWSKTKGQNDDWTVTLDFRAGGGDQGKGNLHVWYVDDGEKKVSTSSIYTASRFDGLAVVVDTTEGIQKIRGFLNDGTIDYSGHNNVDSLAFGHCDYTYRNLGRPSKLKVKSTSDGLEVTIDDKACFATNKVRLPQNYNYGITAASNDPPDSFEVFKFQAEKVNADSKRIATPGGATGQQPMQDTFRQYNKAATSSSNSNPSPDTNMQRQFQDLNARFDQLSKSVSDMMSELSKNTKVQEDRYQEILRQMPSSTTIGSLSSRLSNLDRMIGELNTELKGGNHKEQFARISAQLVETHQGLTQHLPSTMRDYVQNHTPRIGFIVFSFMAFQSCCLAVLLWQKWRKSHMPKKFL